MTAETGAGLPPRTGGDTGPERSELAPAKINWALEVLGRREDGYHELITVLETVSLFDELRFEPADRLEVVVEGPEVAALAHVGGDSLVRRAAAALADEAGAAARGRVRISKRIPVGAGLGGGSSDAAAAVRLLTRCWELPLDPARDRRAAERCGSDVPFFLRGGLQLAEGRGERLTPLPPWPAPRWLVLAAPAAPPVERKTARVFAALRPEEWTRGDAVRGWLADRRRPPFNGLLAGALRVFPLLAHQLERIGFATGRAVCLSGAGPSVFVPLDGPEDAPAVLRACADVGLRAWLVSAVAGTSDRRMNADAGGEKGPRRVDEG